MTSPAVPQGIPPAFGPMSWTDRQLYGDENYIKLLEAELRRRPPESSAEGLAKLREPFQPHEIEKLPKGNTMLDYIGHAGTTDRILDADPLWNWEPVAWEEDGPRKGFPKFERNLETGQPIGLWIKLTICGVTRYGYGSVDGTEGDPEKEAIGDAIRNAAMRFGVALHLWMRRKSPQPPASKPPKDTRPKEVRDMEKRGAQHDALANTDAATKAREQMAADLLDNRGPRNVLGIPVLLTWPVAKDMQIGSYAATYKPGVPSAKDLALKTWGWASEGSSQGEREAFLEALVNRARELVKKESLPLPNNLQCAVLAYDRSLARLSGEGGGHEDSGTAAGIFGGESH